MTYHGKNDFPVYLYTILRIGLGLYLLFHALDHIIHFNQYLKDTEAYLGEDSMSTILQLFIPIVPMIEFFIALMITMGLYTRISLIGAIATGIIFIIAFFLFEDYDAGIVLLYSLAVKTLLLFTVKYNRISADYRNIQIAEKEMNELLRIKEQL